MTLTQIFNNTPNIQSFTKIIKNSKKIEIFPKDEIINNNFDRSLINFNPRYSLFTLIISIFSVIIIQNQ